MDYQVRLEIFEGPMDLLLHLIDKAEIDIYDIPIAEITHQYVDYLFALDRLDLEIASSFLVMAATLLSIKVRMLLPKQSKGEQETSEEDPRSELIRQLIAYKFFKKAAADLSDREKKRCGIELCSALFRGMENAEPDYGLQDITVTDLCKAYLNAIASSQAVAEPVNIPREIIPIRKKIEDVLRRIFHSTEGVTFNTLIDNPGSKHERIVTFLAILELARSKHIRIHQTGNFYEITIYRNTREER
jgi:segregation and condensation protein A